MEDFVTYEIAVKLKEKGFDDECHAYYYEPLKHCLNFSRVFKTNSLIENYNCITAPTVSQVLKWLREKRHTYIYVDVCKAGYFFEVKCLRSFYMINTTFFDKHKSYEQAAIAGIEYVIDNLI